MITWDETKRAMNKAKHGIDLAQVGRVFDAPMLTIEDDCIAYGEQRLKSLAWLNNRVVVLLWTERDSGAHVFPAAMPTKIKPVNTSMPCLTEAMKAAAMASAPEATDPAEDWSYAIQTHGSGVAATLAELRRARGQRGAQKAPKKVSTALRMDAEALNRWRASGKGWQTRAAALLAKYAP